VAAVKCHSKNAQYGCIWFVGVLAEFAIKFPNSTTSFEAREAKKQKKARVTASLVIRCK